MECWFLVYCKSNQDTRAETNLIRQGYNVFRPEIHSRKTGKVTQLHTKTQPLFPRYLFIKLDPSIKPLAPVTFTYGVMNFVKFGDRYATASDRLIEEIKARIKKHITLDENRTLIKKGEEVLVNGYGFEHEKAIYCNPCGKERAMILMSILGKESKMTVPLESLTRTSMAG